MEKEFRVQDCFFGDYVRVIEGSSGWEYCTKLNDAVKSVSVKNGKRFRTDSFAGVVYESSTNGVRLTYKDSDYGNNAYFIEIHDFVWNDVPPKYANVVNENGWNLVYSALENPDKMLVNVNIPGKWISLFSVS